MNRHHARVVAACHALCLVNGTAQCAPICLTELRTGPLESNPCPRAELVFGKVARLAAVGRLRLPKNLQLLKKEAIDLCG